MTIGRFYNVVARYHSGNSNPDAAMKFCQSGLALATSMGSPNGQAVALSSLAWIKREFGDLAGAKEAASESQRMAKIAGNLHIEAFSQLQLLSHPAQHGNPSPGSVWHVWWRPA
jgi:hypothetical protein